MNKKYFGWIILVVVLFLLVVAAFLGKQFLEKKEARIGKGGGGGTGKVSPTEFADVETTIVQEEIEYQRYENKEYDFSILYPKEWEYREVKNEETEEDVADRLYLLRVYFAPKGKLPAEGTDAPSPIMLSVLSRSMEDSERTSDLSKLKKENIKVSRNAVPTEVKKYTLEPGRKNDFLGESKFVQIEIPLSGRRILLIENMDDLYLDIFETMINSVIVLSEPVG